MGFNGIAGSLSSPGQIPWPIIFGYFVIAIGIAVWVGRRNGGLGRLNTLDYVYIGVGGAFAVVWDFYLGAFIGRAIPSTPFFDISFIGEFLIVLVIVSVVRKFGVGMLTMFVYTLLGDLFHYGFGGEPVYLFYEALTYGLFFDLMIVASRGNIFGVAGKIRNSVNTTRWVGSLEGAIIGYLFGAIPYAIFWLGFFAPFVYGGVVTWGRIYFLLWAYGISNVPVGILGSFIARRVATAVGV
ncbi:MAG: hypothetical protein JRN37_03090 [Nitrososphaerota archaeon]|jgi:hypothetical protein|nr:hypothetical protein [Nitrososphaerota archaeon]MDG7038135.1 hypothetical protein [Nitrososphaerota archaeon]MDG7039880.1 hypothetical protein [Nitrososphaerota archaeon]MDG7042546.1 hypothetical protein [Nitrososphaerota archaeon]MDG7046411.1 hypothetical protein [Nitrososphaerota archaeon]